MPSSLVVYGWGKEEYSTQSSSLHSGHVVITAEEAALVCNSNEHLQSNDPKLVLAAVINKFEDDKEEEQSFSSLSSCFGSELLSRTIVRHVSCSGNYFVFSDRQNSRTSSQSSQCDMKTPHQNHDSSVIEQPGPVSRACAETRSLTPVLEIIASNIFTKQLAAGDSHCLISTSECLYSIGSCTHGELGIGRTMPWTDQMQTVLLPIGESPRCIAAGCNFSCVITEPRGSLYTFGCSSYGKLGQLDDDYHVHNDDERMQCDSVRVNDQEHQNNFPNRGGSSRIPYTDTHSLTGEKLRPSTHVCKRDVDGNCMIPTLVAALEGVGELQADGTTSGLGIIACGLWHVTAVARGSNDVFTWGWGKFGQTGLEREFVDYPCRVSSLEAPQFLGGSDFDSQTDGVDMGIDIVTALSCGTRHTALLTSTGRVIVMGQLGYGNSQELVSNSTSSLSQPKLPIRVLELPVVPVSSSTDNVFTFEDDGCSSSSINNSRAVAIASTLWGLAVCCVSGDTDRATIPTASSLTTPSLATSSLHSVRVPVVVVVMGVSGAGKSTLASALAKELDLPFLEGDDFHPAHNKALMASGVPLTDEDRWGWLDILCSEVVDVVTSQLSQDEVVKVGVVLSCSALKKKYRDRLRDGISPVYGLCHKPREELSFYLIHPYASMDSIQARVAARADHFMPVSLLQLIERLEKDVGTAKPVFYRRNFDRQDIELDINFFDLGSIKIAMLP